MKIQKTNIKLNKLFYLKLLKTKIYKKKKNFTSIKIKSIELSLKKAFFILYKYHIYHKKILFVGTPENEGVQIAKLLSNTKHTFLPDISWINGAISNSPSITKHLFKKHKLNKNESTLLFNLNKKYDLIVILNESLNKAVLNESLNTHAPILSLNYYFNSLYFNPSTYKILGNFYSAHTKTKNNYFYTILNSVFKKAEKHKKKLKLNRY